MRPVKVHDIHYINVCYKYNIFLEASRKLNPAPQIHVNGIGSQNADTPPDCQLSNDIKSSERLRTDKTPPTSGFSNKIERCKSETPSSGNFEPISGKNAAPAPPHRGSSKSTQMLSGTGTL